MASHIKSKFRKYINKTFINIKFTDYHILKYTYLCISKLIRSNLVFYSLIFIFFVNTFCAYADFFNYKNFVDEINSQLETEEPVDTLDRTINLIPENTDMTDFINEMLKSTYFVRYDKNVPTRVPRSMTNNLILANKNYILTLNFDVASRFINLKLSNAAAKKTEIDNRVNPMENGND